MKTTTRVTNQFTGYEATIKTNGFPSVSTLKKHQRNSKALNCHSVTRILTNVQEDGSGDEIEIYHGEIMVNGRPA